jgi:putative heme transporter
MTTTPSSTDTSPSAPDSGAGEEGTQLLNRKRLLLSLAVIVFGLIGLYFLVPKIAGLNHTWGQLQRGDPVWLGVGAVLEALSIACYAALFEAVFGCGVPRIDWRVSVEIPLAGIAAIRLLAAAGAGGVAVTVWALRHAGMEGRTIGSRMVANLVIQYAIYLLALIVCGLGLWAGLFEGGGSFALTIVPAIFAAVLGLLVLGMGLVPEDFERRLRRLGGQTGLIGRLATRLAPVPTTIASGVRAALSLAWERPWGLLAAIGYWGFDIAVLGLSLRAFGAVVSPSVIVMSYFLGTLGSLLPLPGGIGGVEGGMIGALAAFGVPGGQAVVGVLAYRAISFWLPTLPGIGGYLALRATVRGWTADDERREEQGVARAPASPAAPGRG